MSAKKSIFKPRYVPHNELDRLTMEANQYQAPKKTRVKKEKCPHLNWWESSNAAGLRMRKCQMCPRTEVMENGAWIKPKRVVTSLPKPSDETTKKA